MVPIFGNSHLGTWTLREWPTQFIDSGMAGRTLNPKPINSRSPPNPKLLNPYLIAEFISPQKCTLSVL